LGASSGADTTPSGLTSTRSMSSFTKHRAALGC
jgi:hypothetical protein